MINPFKRPNTKQFMIADLAVSGHSKMQAFTALRNLVDDQVPPMIFTFNPGDGRARIPKSHAEQLIELKHAIGRIYQQVGRAESPDFDSPEIDSPEDEVSPEDFDSPELEIEIPEDEESDEDEDEDEPPVQIRKKAVVKTLDELQYFERRMKDIRAFCENRETLSDPVDDLSTMRPEEAANRLIPRGVPADALLHAMTLHWPKDTRESAEIRDFDLESFSLSVMEERGIPTGEFHSMFGYALLLAEARQAILCVGPAGTGKSFLAKQLASYLELSYAETPMTPGATRGDLLGRHTIGGFIPSAFCEIYAGGGVFNFEEIDASDASMLIVLNNALAQDSLYNSSNGEQYDRSSNFCAFATANTFGLGATRQFSGRERLDDATLDRWRMGRIVVRADENVRSSILYRGI